MSNIELDNIIDNTIDRVKFFIKYKKISLRKFAEIIGVSHSLINNIKSLGSDKLESILFNYPEINPTWLLTGKGEMLLVDIEHSSPQNMNDNINTALSAELILLKEINQLLKINLKDKERIIKILEEENRRLLAEEKQL